MRAANLTERQRTSLEHLRRAQERGLTLPGYAAAFNLNVKDLYNGRAQLQRKGLWTKTSGAQRSGPKLLAVQVREPETPQVTAQWVCRLSGPGGWAMECRQLPDIAWLAALCAATGRTSP